MKSVVKPSGPQALAGSSSRLAAVLALLSFFLAVVTAAAGASSLVIRNGQLFDSAAGRMVPFGAILIEGDRITAVTPVGVPLMTPAGAQVIEARGKFLIPGLIDAHVHLVHILRNLQITADEIFPLFLANGVTSLRDVGDEIVAQKLLFKYTEAHPESAPRLVMGSPLVDGAPPYHPFISVPMTDPAKVPAFVDEMSAWGVQTFKLYVGTGRPVGQAVIREAHRHGKWVTAHLAWNYRAQDAVEDGIDSIEHIGSIMEFILPPETPRWPPPPERAGIPAPVLAATERKIMEIKARLDFTSPRTTDLVAAMVRHHTMLSPTLVVYRNWMLLRDQPVVLQHPDLAQIPARLRDGWLLSAKYAPLDATTQGLRQQQFAKMEELTGLLYRSGVELLVGTDTPVQFCPPGFAMHQELELLVESGLTPAAALTAATRNNARALNQSAQLGSLEAGKLADVVILDGNPLEDIRNTRKIDRVIRGGIVCDPAVLRNAVSSK